MPGGKTGQRFMTLAEAKIGMRVLWLHGKARREGSVLATNDFVGAIKVEWVSPAGKTGISWVAANVLSPLLPMNTRELRDYKYALKEWIRRRGPAGWGGEWIPKEQRWAHKDEPNASSFGLSTPQDIEAAALVRKALMP